MNKKMIMAVLIGTLMFSFNIFNVVAFESDSDPNTIISINENIIIASTSLVRANRAVSITYDHNSSINWDRGYRQVAGDTQAKQGTVKLDSYTRARFETWPLGIPYLDSGRCWSSGQGRSYAYSGWELFSTLDSGVAHTYYGIED